MSRFPHYDAIALIIEGAFQVDDRHLWLILDGVADLLIDHCRERRRHSKEMFEEQRYAQRDTREAIAEAILHDRQERDAW